MNANAKLIWQCFKCRRYANHGNFIWVAEGAYIDGHGRLCHDCLAPKWTEVFSPRVKMYGTKLYVDLRTHYE